MACATHGRGHRPLRDGTGEPRMAMYKLPVWSLEQLNVEIFATDDTMPVEKMCEDARLVAAKERVGKTKVIQGESSWKTAMNYVDPYATLPQLRRVPSRSYFKLIELAKELKCPENVLCLCEAPGGFVQASYDMWTPKRLVAHSRQGEDSIQFKRMPRTVEFPELGGGGDILNDSVVDGLIAKCGREFDLVTADGSLDIENNHAAAETVNMHIMIRECLIAIMVQRIGGDFVLKVFDIETLPLAGLIQIVSTLYAETAVIKPLTSRATNGEKYVVFRGFTGCLDSAQRVSTMLSGLDPSTTLRRIVALDDSDVQVFKSLHAFFCKTQLAALNAALRVAAGNISGATDNLAAAFWEEHKTMLSHSVNRHDGPQTSHKRPRDGGNTSAGGSH